MISAIDPVATLSVFADLNVPPLLYNLVFGESVLNDAVAIALFRSIEAFYEVPLSWMTIPNVMWRFTVISVGSLMVGIGVAMTCAFILKRFQISASASKASGPHQPQVVHLKRTDLHV